MKKIKILTAVLLSLCLAFAVTGCSGDNLKDSVINGFNDMLQHFSKYALTDEKDLQGDKTKGEDTYTGSYTADYEDFNDKEYIFGGTALERDKGSELTVTYELTVDSGTAKLYWLDKGEEKMIADIFQYFIVRQGDLRSKDICLVFHSALPHIENIKFLEAASLDRFFSM